MLSGTWDVRIAKNNDAVEIAQLLHDFNTEFETPSPGPRILADRLFALLGSDGTFALLAGRPAIALALVTLRSNVWYDGRVALLDELYVVPGHRNQGVGSAFMNELVGSAKAFNIDLIEINVDEGDADAQRFYARHGFVSAEPVTQERAFYFFRDFTTPPE